MLKLMVVDDEQIVLDSVRFIVERDLDGYEICATARSGTEAILRAEQTVPDLILMDIRMPGLNGLEAIREIRTRLPAVRFVVISACEQFEYARQSVELGVLEYVVKPLKRTHLIGLLTRAADALDQERRRRQRDLENMEKLEKLLPVLEQGFIHAILLHGELGGELGRYRELFGISANRAFMMTIELREGVDEKADDGSGEAGADGLADSGGGETANAIGSSIRAQQLLPAFAAFLKSRRVALVGPMMVNRVIVCVLESGSPSEYVQRLSSIQLAEEVADFLAEQSMRMAAEEAAAHLEGGAAERLPGLSCRIGIGGLLPIEQMPASYADSIRALRQAGPSGILHIMDVAVEDVYLRDFDLYESAILQALAYGEPQAVGEQLGRLFLSVDPANPLLRTKLAEWTVVAHRHAMENGVPEDREINYQTYLAEMQAIGEVHALTAWVVNRFRLLAGRICEVKQGRNHRLVETARRIIDSGFAGDVSLESVSNAVNLSPRHFSKVFKDVTGTTFIDYLTALRITRAKELMTTTDKSVKEICYEVGYGDPNYFSRLFRKQTGMSPTEFARR